MGFRSMVFSYDNYDQTHLVSKQYIVIQPLKSPKDELCYFFLYTTHKISATLHHISTSNTNG